MSQLLRSSRSRFLPKVLPRHGRAVLREGLELGTVQKRVCSGGACRRQQRRVVVQQARATKLRHVHEGLPLAVLLRSDPHKRLPVHGSLQRLYVVMGGGTPEGWADPCACALHAYCRPLVLRIVPMRRCYAPVMCRSRRRGECTAPAPLRTHVGAKRVGTKNNCRLLTEPEPQISDCVDTDFILRPGCATSRV